MESLHDDLAIDRIRDARVIKAEYGTALVENTAVSTQQLRVSALLRQHFDATLASRDDQVQLLQLIGQIGVAAEDPVLTTRLGDVVPKDPRTVSKWAEGDPNATLPSDAPVFTVTFNIKSLGLLQSTATLTRCDLTMVLQQMLLDERFVPYMTFCSSHKRMPLPGETGPEFCDSKLCWDLQQTVTPGVPILWVALWADGAETGRLGSMHPVVLALFNTPFALRHEKGAVRHIGILPHVYHRLAKDGMRYNKTAAERAGRLQLYQDAFAQIMNALDHLAKNGIRLAAHVDGPTTLYAIRGAGFPCDLSEKADAMVLNLCNGESVCASCLALNRVPDNAVYVAKPDNDATAAVGAADDTVAPEPDVYLDSTGILRHVGEDDVGAPTGPGVPHFLRLAHGERCGTGPPRTARNMLRHQLNCCIMHNIPRNGGAALAYGRTQGLVHITVRVHALGFIHLFPDKTGGLPRVMSFDLLHCLETGLFAKFHALLFPFVLLFYSASTRKDVAEDPTNAMVSPEDVMHVIETRLKGVAPMRDHRTDLFRLMYGWWTQKYWTGTEWVAFMQRALFVFGRDDRLINKPEMLQLVMHTIRALHRIYYLTKVHPKVYTTEYLEEVTLMMRTAGAGLLKMQRILEFGGRKDVSKNEWRGGANTIKFHCAI